MIKEGKSKQSMFTAGYLIEESNLKKVKTCGKADQLEKTTAQE